ncbi:hypothetical protein AKJ47_00080 [candidate division MSBL1 archaeon SCGC-AAA261G05]|uniref:Uncharacterized protein n=3 Tax=candidate division MSBL1 TaxID=215777 RepID=A0A133V0L6_9EURY|nr:hypothetical protein AKJ42_01980 [candidate division MSBL1 archaeon SCGC-AAA261C02]KXB04242.1 hypothetical protein AKJ47_00080 [candidate division MSBL1 archaeon SCGC-AAA261G05]KXB05106.1 hypothetical protein AKJ48_00105 [candidate division MSBL1 archaeon SCGC-AAA261O19]
MNSTVTTRVDEKTKKELERISKVEHLDRSAIVRRLLEEAIRDYKLSEALKKYQRGEASLGKAAEHAGVSLRRILKEMRERDIHFEYSMDSLKEDVRAD